MRFDLVRLAPVLGEDVVNVDILLEKDRIPEFLARTKILCSFLHQESIDPLVGSRQPHTHSLQSVSAEHRLAYRRWFRATLQPNRYFHEIASDARFDRRAVQLTKYPIPIPPHQHFFDLRML